MKKRLSLLVILLILVVTFSACEKDLREPNTPAETSVNMIMSLNDGDFDGFKSYLHDNFKATVKLDDFNKLKNIINSSKYSLNTYVIMELENDKMFLIRFAPSKEKNKDVALSIKAISKDSLDAIKKIYEDDSQGIKF